MHYEEVMKHLAPCGLDCGRCADYDGGEIGRLSKRMLELLGNYPRVAAMKAEGRPEFAGYGQFEAVLESFARGSCGGCRSERNACPIDCLARTCSKEKGVDFCFQCAEYPCERQFAWSLPMRNRWQALNGRMRDIGVEAFYAEQLGTPRYPGKLG